MSIIFTAIIMLAFAAPPTPTPEITTSPSNISITESGAANYPVTPEDKRKLLKEYERALLSESKALDHQERAAVRELSAAQNARAREWRENEKKSRRAYFDKVSSGPERRKYVQDFVARKKGFDQSLKEEMQGTRKAWREKKDKLKATHKENMVQFKAQLEQNKRPDASLWPTGH